LKVAYRAIDGSGRNVQDIVEATGISEALEMLRRDGLFVTDVEEASAGEVVAAVKNKVVTAPRKMLRIKHSQLLMLTRQMAMLLQAGSPVVPALTAIGRQTTGKLRHVIDSVRTNMEQGRTLTESLRDFPGVFSDTYAAIVGAGEQSANLDTMFTRLGKMVGDQQRLRNRVMGAMAYPILLIMLSIAIVSSMVVVVVPRFKSLFETLDVPLPWTTKAMVAVSSTLRVHWIPVVCIGVGGIVLAVTMLRSQGGRQWLCNLQTRLPIIGRMGARMIQARVFRVMGLLLESRVSMMEMLELVRRMTRNADFEKMFSGIYSEIEGGGRFGEGLARNHMTPPSVGQAIITGEESGRLDQALLFVADILDEENDQILNTATKLIEPIILILMGTTVGGIAMSLFIPLFDLAAAAG
jgi:type II secretory pathway component PulF